MFENERHYAVQAGCLALFRAEKAAGTEMPAIVGALQEFIEGEEERLRTEREAVWRNRVEEERIALEQRFLSGADSKWTPIAKSKDLFRRINGRAYKLSPTKDNKWDLFRIEAFDDQKPPLIGCYGIFGLADELDVQGDELRGFSIGNNELRIHWLMNRLVTDRFPIEERDAIYGTAMAFAPVHWACTFARRCIRSFEPDDGRNSDRQPIVSEGVAQGFKELAITRLRTASEDGSLIANRSMTSLLFQWNIWTSIAEVRAWTDETLANDAFVIAVANGVTSVGWTQSVGDMVARPIVRVNPAPLGEILDLERFEVRATEVATREDLPDAERQIMDRFLTAPRGDGMNSDRTDGD